MINKNAIILAAGKSSNFAPFIYEKPKGLFRVKGEILVERQIKQLKEAGINDIYIIVGYMKEKFFYLEEKYGVKLITNNTFATKGNIYSLYVAKEYLSNSFICCADQYFVHNPFKDNNFDNISYRSCVKIAGKTSEFVVDFDENKVINKFGIGEVYPYAMVGHAYFNSDFSRKFVELMNNKINDFGIGNLFWEEFYARHLDQLEMHAKLHNKILGFEFDCVEDLMRFDADFLLNIDSNIIENICKTLNCKPNEIKNIKTIQAGLTNVSFSFIVNNTKYVYRHPGWTAGNIVDRKTELFAQTLAKDIGIDNSFITMGDEGWKISHYIDNLIKCDFQNNHWQRKLLMDYLRKIHNADISGARLLLRDFDPVEETIRLWKIASAVKGDIFSEFADLISNIKLLYKYIKNDRLTKERKKVLCHIDVYDPNFLCTKDHQFYMIDWEFAGLNYPAFDLCSMFSRYEFSDELINEYISEYLQRSPTKQEIRYYRAYTSINAFYWLGWSFYKGSVGEDDGFFFLTAYRNCLRFLQESIDNYEKEQMSV